ncbi:hypothetical protein F4782DRAFT_498374 [Xylaria castorea]|nr:hypothetical protein F4782DRAFT_498374 [Xylaria castorea]
MIKSLIFAWSSTLKAASCDLVFCQGSRNHQVSRRWITRQKSCQNRAIWKFAMTELPTTTAQIKSNPILLGWLEILKPGYAVGIV